MEGTPVFEVISAPVFPVEREERTLALLVNRRVLVPPKLPTPVPPLETARCASEFKVPLLPEVYTAPLVARLPNCTVPLAFKFTTPERLPFAVRFAPLAVRAVDPAEVKTTFPVLLPPSVRLCALVVPRLPSPVKKVVLLDRFPEREAVGTPDATFSKANFAALVEVPPSRRSSVILRGLKAPLFLWNSWVIG